MCMMGAFQTASKMEHGRDAMQSFPQPSGYRSYLLRFWEERSEQSALTLWRISLEDPSTGQRRGFASLEALMAWLQSELARLSRTESDEARPSD